MKTQVKYTANDAGCYVDGVRGCYAIDRVIELAEQHGFDIHDDDPANPLPELLSEYEFVDDILQEVDEYMNNTFPVEGYSWSWRDGDWGLWKDSDDDATDSL